MREHFQKVEKKTCFYCVVLFAAMFHTERKAGLKCSAKPRSSPSHLPDDLGPAEYKLRLLP